ncbi:hypothetical protein KO528_16830 [Saccharophagus degradans]|uniref:hypothetical protein n=1 Tax=Saccharophagus degradans TaxID=86304 RepID=UPI001C099E61|nr:hypothetical protein [Saccharophagus degradans]MBU2987034.1 hypothetical protein [Saccharophagus degradans]
MDDVAIATGSKTTGQSPLANEAIIEKNERTEIERYRDIYSSFDDVTLLKEYNRIYSDPNSSTNLEALQRLSAMLQLLRTRNIDPEVQNRPKEQGNSDIGIGAAFIGALTVLFIGYKLFRIFTA